MATPTSFQDMYNTKNPEVLTLSPHPVTGRLIDSHPGVRTRPMRLLVLGASRTGTVSIMTALEQLGYNPYHMSKALKNPRLSFSLWCEALSAKFHPSPSNPPWTLPQFDAILGSYDAVSDVPTICFASELIAAYPDAKVLLNTRPVDAWLRSMDATAGRCLRWKAWPLLARWDDALVGPWWDHGKVVMDAAYGTMSDFSAEGPAKGKFEELYEGVRRELRARGEEGRLLEYSVKEGWGPLCEFLGEERPEGVEFPSNNDAEAFVRIHVFMWWLGVGRMVWGVAVRVAPVVGVGAAVWWRRELAGAVGRWFRW